MKDYSDIINLPHHVSKHHKPMSMYNRAAQFSPFAALVGYEGMIHETGRATDEKPELDEYEKSEINSLLQFLMTDKDREVEILYFLNDERKSGGSCLSERCSIRKIDIDRHQINTSNATVIDIDDILHISLV